MNKPSRLDPIPEKEERKLKPVINFLDMRGMNVSPNNLPEHHAKAPAG